MSDINAHGNGSRAPMHLAVRDLRLIVTIAQMGGVSRAADALHLTQSTLSHHLADLETRVGAPLFHRSGRNLILTPLGEAFKEGAMPLLDEIALLERNLGRGGLDQLVGSVRFATECYTTYAWLPRVTRKFQTKCPGVELRLITEATLHPMPALETGALDVAITMGRPAGRKFCALPLFEDELVALVPPDHAWASRRSISVEAFRDTHLLIYHSDPMDSSFIRNVLLPAGVFPRRVSGIQVTEGLLEFAKAGLGVPVLARWAAAEPIRKKALVPLRIGRSGVHRTWHAVWLRTSTKHEWLESFAGLLQAHALQQNTEELKHSWPSKDTVPDTNRLTPLINLLSEITHYQVAELKNLGPTETHKHPGELPFNRTDPLPRYRRLVVNLVPLWQRPLGRR